MESINRNDLPGNPPFIEQVRQWSDHAAATDFPQWEEQIRLLSELGDLITPDLTIEEVIAAIYYGINQLMDAYQFAVGLYDEKEGTILFKGMIENNNQLPDFLVDVKEHDRFAPWCVLHDAEIFINDMATESNRYVKTIPFPKVGNIPNAALYVPLHMEGKVAGLILVRTLNKHVYYSHHLYLLKTVGNFVIRTLELAQERTKLFMSGEGSEKKWRWCDAAQLSSKSKRLLSLLTEREKEVLFLLVSGLPNKVIAQRLFVSPGTIKTHTLNIYQKLEVSSRTSAILKAIELSWFV